MTSWQIYQNRTKVFRQIKKFRNGIYLLIILILLIGVVSILYWLNAVENAARDIPLNQIPSDQFERQVNLFVPPNWLVGFDFAHKEVKYFQTDARIDPADLSILSKNRQIIIDGYLLGPGSTDEVSEIIEIQSYVARNLFKDSLMTNLTKLQVWQLWWFLHQDVVYLHQESSTLFETQIFEEKVAASVLNGTNINGLAVETSGWLSNLGIEVVETGNNPQTVTKSAIINYVDPAEIEYTLKRLEELFQVETKHISDQSSRPYDLQIIVGEDFIE